MHVGAPLEAHQEPAELMQPREAPLDRPADPPETRAMGGAPAGDQRADAASAKLPAVGVVVVAPVCDERDGAPAGAAGLPPERGHGIDERKKLGDVVAVAAGQRDRERDA